MLFKLHYFLVTSGACAMSLLLGVFMRTYTDASSIEVGVLFMINPMLDMFFRPILCSKADREQAHKRFLLLALTGNFLGSIPFICIPLLGPQVYETYPRACYYILLASKTFSGLSASVQSTMADSLAINYAKRVGVEFSVYRVWGTISWMLFGIIVGLINEVPFLPKYVPAFLILDISLLLDMALIWLWPDEYFRMVNQIEIDGPDNPAKQLEANAKRTSKLEDFKRSLMPRDVILAHIKSKLHLTFKLGGKNAQLASNEMVFPVKLEDAKTIDVIKQSESGERKQIGKMLQLRTLGVLICRDPRLSMYLGFLIIMGVGQATLGFIVMGLSHECHSQSDCDFSLLAGLIQVSMASAETILFIYVKDLKRFMDRLGMVLVTLACAATKNLLYGLLWGSVHPYWAICNELIHGVQFGLFLTVMVELAHTFSSQVVYLIPEFKQRSLLAANGDDDIAFKTSLAATMQAIVSISVDAIGNGFGSIFLGAFTVACVIKIYDMIYKPKLGLDKKHDQFFDKNKQAEAIA